MWHFSGQVFGRCFDKLTGRGMEAIKPLNLCGDQPEFYFSLQIDFVCMSCKPVIYYTHSYGFLCSGMLQPNFLVIDVEKLLRDVFRPEDLVPLPKSGMNPLLAIRFGQNALLLTCW